MKTRGNGRIFTRKGSSLMWCAFGSCARVCSKSARRGAQSPPAGPDSVK